MTKVLSLTIVTPLHIVLHVDGVTSLRGEDESGGFGILPGHADFLTAMDAAVLHWRVDAKWHYAALRGAVFDVTRGTTVRIACREAIFDDDLARLEARVLQARSEQADQARSSKMTQTRLHARAIRQMMRALNDSQEISAILSEASP